MYVSGFSYVKQLRGKARLVATPAYGHAGCGGALNRSFVIVRQRPEKSPISEKVAPR